VFGWVQDALGVSSAPDVAAFSVWTIDDFETVTFDTTTPSNVVATVQGNVDPSSFMEVQWRQDATKSWSAGTWSLGAATNPSRTVTTGMSTATLDSFYWRARFKGGAAGDTSDWTAQQAMAVERAGNVPEETPEWTGMIVAAMTGWFGRNTAVIDTSGQDYRLRDGDFHYFQINFHDSTDVTPDAWGYTEQPLGINGSTNFDLDLANYGSYRKYCFLTFDDGDSMWGATVDSAYLMIPYTGSSDAAGTDSILVAGVSNSLLHEALQNSTVNEANWQYYDISETSAWSANLSTISRTNIGDVTSFLIGGESDWVIDVTDVVQHLLDSNAPLMLGLGGTRSSPGGDDLRLYHLTQSTERSPALVIYLSE
jgi:hypothetical protein